MGKTKGFIIGFILATVMNCSMWSYAVNKKEDANEEKMELVMKLNESRTESAYYQGKYSALKE